MVSRRHAALVVILLNSCFVPNSRAASYRSPEGFTLTLPDDWQVMPADVVQGFNAAARERGLSKGNLYVGGALRSIQSPTTPYFLFQVIRTPTTGATFEQFAQQFGSGGAQFREVESKIGPNASLKSQGAQADPSRNRVIMRSSARNDIVGSIEGLSFAVLGRDRIVILHGYAPKGQFGQWEPVLRRIGDSFQHDAGFEFAHANLSPATPAKSPGLFDGTSKAIAQGLGGGLVMAFVGFMLWLVAKLSGAGRQSRSVTAVKTPPPRKQDRFCPMCGGLLGAPAVGGASERCSRCWGRDAVVSFSQARPSHAARVGAMPPPGWSDKASPRRPDPFPANREE